MDWRWRSESVVKIFGREWEAAGRKEGLERWIVKSERQQQTFKQANCSTSKGDAEVLLQEEWWIDEGSLWTIGLIIHSRPCICFKAPETITSSRDLCSCSFFVWPILNLRVLTLQMATIIFKDFCSHSLKGEAEASGGDPPLKHTSTCPTEVWVDDFKAQHEMDCHLK